jgi:hypothetical protein
MSNTNHESLDKPCTPEPLTSSVSLPKHLGHRMSYHSDNFLDSYSEGVQFESRSRHQIISNNFSGFLQSLLVNAWIAAQLGHPFQCYHSSTRSYAIWANGNAAKQHTKKKNTSEKPTLASTLKIEVVQGVPMKRGDCRVAEKYDQNFFFF